MSRALRWPGVEKASGETEGGLLFVRHGVIRAVSTNGQSWRGQVLQESGNWSSIPGYYCTADDAIREANASI